jgi:hypothetical protein
MPRLRGGLRRREGGLLAGERGNGQRSGQRGALLDLGWDSTLVEGLRRYAWDDYRNGIWLSVGFARLAPVASLHVTESDGRDVGDRAGPA